MHSFSLTDEIGVIGVRGASDSYKDLFTEYKDSDFIFMNQVHGNKLVDLREKNNLEEDDLICDGLITNKNLNKGKVFLIKTADCVPIIIKVKNDFILIHAGWRGIAKGIHYKILNNFSKKNLGNAKIFIGPHAINNYEVKNDVLEQIDNAKYKIIDESYYLDMQETIVSDYINNNIQLKQIFKATDCTILNKNFYSYRRNNLEKTRNLMYLKL